LTVVDKFVYTVFVGRQVGIPSVMDYY